MQGRDLLADTEGSKVSIHSFQLNAKSLQDNRWRCGKGVGQVFKSKVAFYFIFFGQCFDVNENWVSCAATELATNMHC